MDDATRVLRRRSGFAVVLPATAFEGPRAAWHRTIRGAERRFGTLIGKDMNTRVIPLPLGDVVVGSTADPATFTGGVGVTAGGRVCDPRA